MLEFLRAGEGRGTPVGVDRENRRILGYVVAEAGRFKSGRGQFDEAGLAELVRLGNAESNGLKSRLAHPGLSDSSPASFLGRAKNFRMDSATLPDGRSVAAVRADLHLAKVSAISPRGNLSEYVLAHAEEDPAALSSSVVVQAKRRFLTGPDGEPKKDPDGRTVPPLWTPTHLHASDIVCTGDAVHGLLSAGEAVLDLSDLGGETQLQAFEVLSRMLGHLPRGKAVEALNAFAVRWADWHFGDGSAERRASLAARFSRLGLALSSRKSSA